MTRKPVKPIQLPKLGLGISKTESIRDIQKAASKTAKGVPEIVRRMMKVGSDTRKEEQEKMKPRKSSEEKNSLTEWNKTIHGHVKKSLPLLSLDRVKLPTIEEVFLIMQDHQNKLGMAFRNNKWGEIPAIEAETKKKLEDIGIGMYIDFTPDDKKKEWDKKVAKLAGN